MEGASLERKRGYSFSEDVRRKVVVVVTVEVKTEIFY